MTETRTIKTIRPVARHLLVALMVTSSLAVCAGKQHNDSLNNHYQQNLNTNKMKTILIIGMNPNTIDFSNPEMPKGVTKEMVEQGTKATLEKLMTMGYQAESFLIDTGASDLSGLAKQLKDKHYDGIVVGNGIRGLNSNFILFEQIINVVHANAPKSKIIFNTLPTNTDEAVKRWL
jgi:hypothetical protein